MPPRVDAVADAPPLRPGQESTNRSHPTGSVLTVEQVAKELQVSTRTAERLIGQGTLGSVKIGRRRLVRPDQIRSYLDHRARVENRLH